MFFLPPGAVSVRPCAGFGFCGHSIIVSLIGRLLKMKMACERTSRRAVGKAYYKIISQIYNLNTIKYIPNESPAGRDSGFCYGIWSKDDDSYDHTEQNRQEGTTPSSLFVVDPDLSLSGSGRLLTKPYQTPIKDCTTWKLEEFSPGYSSPLKKSFPLSSTRIKAGKSTTSIFQTASMPSSG